MYECVYIYIYLYECFVILKSTVAEEKNKIYALLSNNELFVKKKRKFH